MSTTDAPRENIRHGYGISPFILTVVLPIATPILIGLYCLTTYIDHRLVEKIDKQFEARKPYVAEQAQLYLETTILLGELATRPRTEEAWKDNDMRFSVLLWSELPAYESQTVQDEMTEVAHKLKDYRESSADAEIDRSRVELQQAATVLSTLMGDDLKSNVTLK